jgi:hypothetical protein
LGLELLVAADIISTISAPLTAESVGQLGRIVAIRTFLSFSLETEIEGCWPWRPAAKEVRTTPLLRLIYGMVKAFAALQQFMLQRSKGRAISESAMKLARRSAVRPNEEDHDQFSV